jgi:hypothetical protein
VRDRNQEFRRTSVSTDVGLIRETETASALCYEIRSNAGLPVCHGCGEVKALISGFLAIIEDEKAVARTSTAAAFRRSRCIVPAATTNASAYLFCEPASRSASARQ